MATKTKSQPLKHFDKDFSGEICYGFSSKPYRNTFIAYSFDSKNPTIFFLGFVSKKSESEKIVAELKKAYPKSYLKRTSSDLSSTCNKILKRNYSLAISGTDFQQSVLKKLSQIKTGQTISYQELAKSVGRPSAIRAVGSAVGRNPISLLIPCHRVIRENGTLGGYRWGLPLKKELLRSEGITI